MLIATRVICFVLVDLVVVWTILSLVFRFLWKPFAQAFPKRAVLETSATKNFQSFTINAMNLGGCVHVTVDDECLHLKPAKMLHWMGLGEASIPWDEIRIEGNGLSNARKRPSSRFVKTRMGDFVVIAPRWCLSMILVDGLENPVI